MSHGGRQARVTILAVMTLGNLAGAQDTVQFRRPLVEIGERWSITRTTHTDVDVTVYVEDELTLSTNVSLDVTEQANTRVVAPPFEGDRLWRFHGSTTIGPDESPFETYVLLQDQTLWYMAVEADGEEASETDGASVDGDPEPAGGTGDPDATDAEVSEEDAEAHEVAADPAEEPEPRVLAVDPEDVPWLESLGVTPIPLTWTFLPEQDVDVGDTLTVPQPVADSLVRGQRLRVTAMTWTLRRALELDGTPCAEFEVRADLEGAMSLSAWNSIPSRTRTTLTGTAVLQLDGGHLRRLSLQGDLRLEGAIQRPDLALRLDGEGSCTLTVVMNRAL